MMLSTFLPLVSIIIPTYNRPSQLKQAIESVLAQTYENVEIVVVNDCGTAAEQIVDLLNGQGNIQYYRAKCNAGLAAARNMGIRNAQGAYIGFLDDDDRLYKDHVEGLLYPMRTNGWDVAFSNSLECRVLSSAGGRVIRKVSHYSEPFDKEKVLVHNLMPVQTVLLKRECLDSVAGFDEELSCHEDWDLWMRLSRFYEFHHIEKVSSEYTQVLDSETANMSRQAAKMLESAQRIYEKSKGWTEGRLPILNARESFLKMLEWRVQGGAEWAFQDLVSKVLEVVEAGEPALALDLYDKTMYGIQDSRVLHSEDRRKFAQLMESLRARICKPKQANSPEP